MRRIKSAAVVVLCFFSLFITACSQTKSIVFEEFQTNEGNFNFLSIPWGTKKTEVAELAGVDFSSAHMETLTDRELYYPDADNFVICGMRAQYLEFEFYKEGLSSVTVYFELEDLESALDRFETLLNEAAEIYGSDYTETENAVEREHIYDCSWQNEGSDEQTAFSLIRQESGERHGIFFFLQNMSWYDAA